MRAGEFVEIPVIDLATEAAALGDRGLANYIVDICHNVGFFVVTNHGVDGALVDGLFDSMARFFALPHEQKTLIDKRESPHFRGWEAVGTERTNNRPDIREQVDLWTEWPDHGPAAEPAYLRLHGPNQWMPEQLVPDQRELVLEWFTQTGALADRLLSLIAIGLGLEASHFADYFGTEPVSFTKLISYPPTPPGQAGVNAHHDTGFLTVLAAGTTPGLQVENEAGVWIDVPCVADSFVINLGEMLQAMTGNYLVATPHRVITETARLSAGYFHGPSLDAVLDPLPLDPHFAEAVRASPRHAQAGFMAGADQTASGVGDMEGERAADTYGRQLWNYLSRSYPEIMARHHTIS